jgi:hypothetical protein
LNTTHEPQYAALDPDKWQPVIMNFSKLYAVSPEQLLNSTLADIDEDMYRFPDIERARTA